LLTAIPPLYVLTFTTWRTSALTAEIGSGVWGTPANANGFRVLAALLQGTGRQTNFAALSRGYHLYSAGRPSRWALAHNLILSCLACDVGVLWSNGWVDQDETWHAGRPRPGHIVLDGDPPSPPQRGTTSSQFSAHICCGQMA